MADAYPVLIVTYARPEGLRKILEISSSAGARDIYVAIDGPKDELTASKQFAILNEIRDFEVKNAIKIKVWQRDRNLGAAVSVVTAIDWFFTNESAGLIFEDDLIPSIEFFSFAKLGLENYEHNKEIWMISGSRMNRVIQNKNTNDWSLYPMIWGWATWRSRWSMMKLAFTSDEKEATSFFSARANFWKVGAFRAKIGMVDAWDMPLAYFQWSNSKFSVIPPVNLVTNVGFDSAATHTSGEHYPLSHPIMELPQSFQFEKVPDISSAHEYDRDLERELFGIKWHHSFLTMYRSLIDKVRNQNMRLGSLEERLNKVVIPQKEL